MSDNHSQRTEALTPGRAVGIDLGTTNSVVAYVNAHGQPEVIPSAEGGRTVPSVFAITAEGDHLVGTPAVDQEATNPEGTVRSIKRSMGTNTCAMLKPEGSKHAYVLHPIDVSSKILSKMKADAEAALGEPVTQAVITVPAYFNDSQRKATVEAGEKAGLKVLRIINEPTAAALAYGLNKAEGETILVYDLGGGTFDVTILEISGDGLFTVKSTAGDTHLGGDDFDEVLIEFILDNYLGDFFVMRPDFVYTMEAREEPILSLDTAQMTRLRDAAEQLKKELSAGKSAAFNIPYFHFEAGNPVHLKGTITRDEFDSAIYPIVERTRVCVKQAMDDAGLKPKDINKVVFVGGSTRVPLISEKVTEWTFQKPNRSVNPDEAVALGAAVQAAVLAKEIEPSVIVLDVTPLSLGIQTMGGVMTRMIGRNTTVPVAFTENFSTAEDGQDAVDIRVYQGERPQAKDNHFLGEFHLEGIPPAPRGTPKIDVTFAVDANGILSVTAVDRATGQEKTVTMTSSSSLSDDEVARRLADAQAHAKEDEALLVKFEAQDTLRSQLIQLEALLRDGAAAIPEDKLAELGELRASLETALADGSPVPVLDSLSSLAEDAIKENSKLVYKAAAQFVGGETVTAETIETE